LSGLDRPVKGAWRESFNTQAPLRMDYVFPNLFVMNKMYPLTTVPSTARMA